MRGRHPSVPNRLPPNKNETPDVSANLAATCRWWMRTTGSSGCSVKRTSSGARKSRLFFSLLPSSLRTYAKPPLIPVQVGSTRAFTRVFDALWAAVRSSGSPLSWGRAEWNSLMRCVLARQSRLIASAEGRLALAESGQLPHACAAGIFVGANMGVDEIGPARGERASQRVGKIGRAVDVHAFDAGRTRHCGKVWIVRRAGLRMAEVGHEFATVETAAL